MKPKIFITFAPLKQSAAPKCGRLVRFPVHKQFPNNHIFKKRHIYHVVCNNSNYKLHEHIYPIIKEIIIYSHIY